MAIKTLSIPEKLDMFLANNPDLSPSKLLQSKIIELMENRRLNNLQVEQLKHRVDFLEKKLWDANDEIDRLKDKNVQLVQQKN